MARLALTNENTINIGDGNALNCFLPETRGHAERIGYYSQILYSKAGYSSEDCQVMNAAATLHDIGKLSIPNAILNKPGSLTVLERKVVESHALAGYEMLVKSPTKMHQLAAVIAATHHEKWDGSGYPHGLCQKNIPFIGRIVALVDVFDALLSKRCYKAAWHSSQVIDQIKSESGKHFDPMVVELFTENISLLLNNSVQAIF